MWISTGVVSNLEHLILVSDKANYYSIPLYKISMSKWKDMGVHINTVATMSGSETIINAFVVKDFDNTTQQIMMVSKNGLIKRTPIVDLKTKTFNRSFKIMKLSDDDQLVSAELVTSKTRYCAIITKNAYAVRYNIEDIPVQLTSSKGVKAANLKDDSIISAISLDAKNDIICFTDKNTYKKIDQNQIPIYIRPKRGVKILLEKKRNKESILFSYAINDDSIIQILDNQDQITDINSNSIKKVSIDSSSTTSEINDIEFVSIKQLIRTTAYDNPAILNSDEQNYTSKAEKQLKQNKVSSKIFVSKEIKQKATDKANQIKGTDLSSYLDDISSVLSNLNSDKSKKQLDFDDLFEEDDE
ncbi:hypothetical protein NX779_02085 [Mycoplasma cottewii]|uniref:DNA gyrase subunit A n=1 Tax=Mycoplasma cottewii TaxID=51364 RepID=A0ABY5U0S7_9MOLU|nr:hypothetical protein NX779_02085 [Mycoplasma cottewii]